MHQTIRQIEEKLKGQMTYSRYRHTQGVMYTASALAMRYSCNIRKAMLAGLLHDCAKCIPAEEMLRLCEKYQVSLSSHEKAHPPLIHAKLGAALAREEYGVKETEVLDAITWHTTGRANMSLLEKIIFVADYIEPNRPAFEGIDLARAACFQDIDEGVWLVSGQSLRHLKQRGISIDRKTEETYEFYHR